MTKEMRVFGPPGCGKTTWISRHMPLWVDRYGSDQVSICSLTNAAVREIVGRDLDVDPGNMTTIHARCKRVLHAGDPAETKVADFIKQNPEYAFEFPNNLVNSGSSSDDAPYSGGAVSSPESMLYTTTNLLRQRLVPFESWDTRSQRFFKAWQGWMLYNGILDFTGWLETAMQEDALPPQRLVIADEAQDYTPLQIKVFRHWRAKHRILVGDDDQNLYQWTGATPEGFLNPPLPPEQEIVLSQSYRVPRAILPLANRTISRLRTRKKKDYRPRDHQGAVYYSPMSLVDFSLDNESNDFMRDYQRYPETDTFMILTSTTFMIKTVCDFLYRHRIPYHNPYRKSNHTWNPLTSVEDTLAPFMSSHHTGDSVARWASTLIAKEVFINRKKESLLKLCEARGSEPITLEELAAYFNPYFLNMVRERDLTLFMNHRRSTLLGSWNFALDIYGAAGEIVKPRVTVGTIHSVKGAEADHVYVFPDISRAAGVSNDPNIEDSLVRLMYVAQTRSRDTLTLASPSTRWAFDF